MAGQGLGGLGRGGAAGIAVAPVNGLQTLLTAIVATQVFHGAVDST
jgi:hypothetical protein